MQRCGHRFAYALHEEFFQRQHSRQASQTTAICPRVGLRRGMLTHRWTGEDAVALAIASTAQQGFLSRKVSSPGEFHPQALREPDVNLSIHPAPIVQPSLPSPRFRFTRTNPPLPGCSCGKTARRRPFGPVPLQNLLPSYERLRPCAPPRYSGACGGCPLARLPLHRGDRFLRSVPTPPSRSRRLHAGRRLSSEQVLLSTRFAEQSLGPGFDVGYGSFDISSAVHLRSSS